MLLNCGVGEDSWESLGCKEIQPVHPKRKSVLNICWKDWCWSWSSNTLATWYEKIEDRDAGKDWRWEEKGMTGDEVVGWHHQLSGHEFWVNSRSWWWTGRPGVLQSVGSQRVRHDWVTELNWVGVVPPSVTWTTSGLCYDLKIEYYCRDY